MIRRTILASFLVPLAVAVMPPRAEAQGTIHYVLDEPTTYAEGCYGICLCVLVLTPEVSGTFELHYSFTDLASFEHYDVTNVDWFVGGLAPEHVVGTGEYVRGQLVAQERLTLDLSRNGMPVEHFDSGIVTPQSTFPNLDIVVSMNGMVCSDKVYYVSAVLDAPGAAFCSGDGSGTSCPCNNNGAAGNGCASSVNPAGASLTAYGSASLSFDTVVLECEGTPDSSVLYFQGTTRQAGGAGSVFGDGLRCAGGTVRRLRTAFPSGGHSMVPGVNDIPLSSIGLVGSPGTRTYQVWYRNAASFCTPSTFNTSNGYEIQWAP